MPERIILGGFPGLPEDSSTVGREHGSSTVDRISSSVNAMDRGVDYGRWSQPFSFIIIVYKFLLICRLGISSKATH